MNELLSLIFLIITFLLTYFCYKKYGQVGLYLWMCISIIICNIQAVKIIKIFGLTTGLGNVFYGSIFLTTDILTEQYGFKAAKKGIILSFICIVIFTIVMYATLLFVPSSKDFSQKSLETIFTFVPRITIASLIAYFVSQIIDSKLYALLKKRFNKLWVSNNLSTMFSQTVDTLIFTFIAYFGILSVNDLWQIIFTTYIVKFIIAIADTPFIYLAKRTTCQEICQQNVKN